MKKAIKIIIGILVVCAGVAGGLFLYNKIKEKQSAIDDDFDDDDFDDDDFDDEDLDDEDFDEEIGDEE